MRRTVKMRGGFRDTTWEVEWRVPEIVALFLLILIVVRRARA